MLPFPGMVDKKDTPNVRRVIVSEDEKDPRVTFKQIKEFLTLANVNVHDSFIGRIMNNHGMHGRVASRTSLPECSLLKIMWTSQRDIGEMFC